MQRAFVACVLSLLLASPAFAATPAEEKAAQAVCAQATKTINAMADFTRTDCTPAKDGDALSLIFVALDPVFANERSKKAYLIAFVAGVGVAINANPRARVTTASLMDKHLAQKRTYFTISAKEAARLQREIKADRLTLDGFYNGILAAGKMRPVSK